MIFLQNFMQKILFDNDKERGELWFHEATASQRDRREVVKQANLRDLKDTKNDRSRNNVLYKKNHWRYGVQLELLAV